MAGPSGGDGQIGFKSETTPGTAVVVDKFLPFKTLGIKYDDQKLKSQTMTARKVLRYVKQGPVSLAGSISTELGNVTLATLLTHMFGSVVTTGAGPYTHTATPGDLTGKALTIQGGLPDSTGTVQPFTWAGCKVKGWKIGCSAGEIATLDLDVIGMTEATATSLAVASYDATWSPFTFVEGAVTVAAVAVASVKSFELSGENMVDHRFRLGSAFSKQPLESGQRSYTGSLVTDFEALTHYNLFKNTTQTAVVLTFTNGANTLAITLNVIFTGETPSISGFEMLEQPLPFECLSVTSDAAAIALVLTNTEPSAS